MVSQEVRRWLEDPDRFWQRVALISVALTVLFAVGAGRLYLSNRQWRAQVDQLAGLNDGQRERIAHLGRQLTEMREQMATLAESLDKLALAGTNDQRLNEPLQNTAPPDPASNTTEVPPPEVPSAEPLEAYGDQSAQAETNQDHTLAADLNRDGIVDWGDFEIFADHWGQSGSSPADLCRDNKIDWEDFRVFAAQWLKTESWYRDDESG